MTERSDDGASSTRRRAAASAALVATAAAIAWLHPYADHWPLWVCAIAAGAGLASGAAPRGPAPRPGITVALVLAGLVGALATPAAGWLRTRTAHAAALDARLRDAVALEVYRSRQGGSILAANDPNAWRRVYERTAAEHFRIRGVEGALLCRINPDLDVRTNEGMSYVPSDRFAALYRDQLVRRWTAATLLASMWFLALVPVGRHGAPPGGGRGGEVPAMVAAAGLAVGATVLAALVPMWAPSLRHMSPWWVLAAMVPEVGLVLWVEMQRPPRR